MAWKLPPKAPRAFKSDLDEACRHWEAYCAGEILDRPIVCVTAPREGVQGAPGATYHDRVFGDMDDVIHRDLCNAAAEYHGGDSIPQLQLSFGPGEVAVFCGADLCWSDDPSGTNWSKPFVEDWEKALPLRIREDHPLYQRMLRFYRRAYELAAGKVLIAWPDLHTNLGLLAAARGSERLCMDLLDQPEMIDQAMQSARAVFTPLAEAVRTAGHLDEIGYTGGIFYLEPHAVLQCDFSYMIGPEMFNRWVMPALEEEAQYMKYASYHWDGPGALVHFDSLMASRGLDSFGYVPGAGHGDIIDHMDLLHRIQKAGKVVSVSGTPDQVKLMHRKLRPEKATYCTRAGSVKEADELVKWFTRNT